MSFNGMTIYQTVNLNESGLVSDNLKPHVVYCFTLFYARKRYFSFITLDFTTKNVLLAVVFE